MSLRRIVLVAAVTAAVVATPRVGATASYPHEVWAGAVGSLAPAYGSYAWPVIGRIIDPFRLPSGPYGSGHRGIDIAATLGTPVHAASGGVVAFAFYNQILSWLTHPYCEVIPKGRPCSLMNRCACSVSGRCRAS